MNPGATMYQRAAFASPPLPSAYPASKVDGYQASAGHDAQRSRVSPVVERRPLDRSTLPPLSSSTSNPSDVAIDVHTPTVVLRRLPRNLGTEGLRSMLLFAKDLIDTEFVQSDQPGDAIHSAAIARFMSLAGAYEAQERLHGKPNAVNDANMIVEVLQLGADGNLGSRRNTMNGPAPRPLASSSSSNGSSHAPISRQSSRYNSTFQSIDNKVSPPLGSPGHSNADLASPELNPRFQNLFSQSSHSNGFGERITGKSVINDDFADDETGDLIANLTYVTNGTQQMARRPTNPQIPLNRFANLTLSTGTSNGSSVPTSAQSAFSSPKAMSSMQSPNSTMSPSSMQSMGSNGSYGMSFARPNYPPANPADQNPPCNTLYVGNLPLDTNEDELKALFSKQRGYKRLCFRTKQNGPMCFVEFEDVSFATKALNELYGHPLHNSVKGGIRLSFSKNPLGVRTGQMNGMGPAAPMSPQGMNPSFDNGISPPPGFSSPNSAPPGLGGSGMRAAPGFPTSGLPDGLGNPYSPTGFGMGNSPLAAMRSSAISGGYPPSSGTGFGSMNGAFSDYMISR